MKNSFGLVCFSVLVLGVMGCGDGDGSGGAGGSGGTGGTGGALGTGGTASGGAATGGTGGQSAGGTGGSGGTSTGGAGGSGGATGGTGGADAVVGCPEGNAPTGDCTEWSNTNEAELCTYGETQCYCQTGQQGATWMCGTCPVEPAEDDECTVTDMTCGDCTCEMMFVQGGQREWSFACGG